MSFLNKNVGLCKFWTGERDYVGTIEIGLRALSSRSGICLFSGNSLSRHTGAKQGIKHIEKIEKSSIYRTQIAVKSITKLVRPRFAHCIFWKLRTLRTFLLDNVDPFGQ